MTDTNQALLTRCALDEPAPTGVGEAQAGVSAVTRVEHRLERYFDEQAARAHRVAARAGGLAPFERLWTAARDSARGGKKLRPALVIDTFAALYRAAGTMPGTADGRGPAPIPETVVDVAAAFELLHTAFLLHDDVIDGDVVRRGRPNLIGAFTAEARARGLGAEAARGWGEASAILAGDLLIHGAHTLVERAGLPHGIRASIEDLLDDAVFVTAAGEHSDVAFASGVVSPTVADVLAMTTAKTANYSFADPLRAGAILAGAPSGLVSVLGEFGTLIGAAFQLRDDVLGVFGDADVVGKSVGGDLRNGKVTALVAHASDSSVWRGSAASVAEAEPESARSALAAAGAKEFAEDLIASHRDAALRLAADPIVPSRLRALLEDCAVRATERAA